MILDGQEEIELIITSPQNPKQKRLVRIPLEGFPKTSSKDHKGADRRGLSG